MHSDRVNIPISPSVSKQAFRSLSSDCSAIAMTALSTPSDTCRMPSLVVMKHRTSLSASILSDSSRWSAMSDLVHRCQPTSVSTSSVTDKKNSRTRNLPDNKKVYPVHGQNGAKWTRSGEQSKASESVQTNFSDSTGETEPQATEKILWLIKENYSVHQLIAR